MISATKNNPNASMSVLFISHSSARGGAELSLLELIRKLSDGNFSCSVILPSQGYMHDELNKIGVKTFIIPVPWWTFEREKDKGDIYDAIVDSCLKIITAVGGEKFDIIYTNTCVIPQGAIIAKELGIPHVWHIDEFGEKDHGLVFLLDFEDRARYIYKNSERIIFNSKALKKDFDEIIPQDKSDVFYYNVELPNIEGAKAGIYRNKASLKLLLVGSINVGKGQFDAIKALKYCVDKYGDNLELVFVGQASLKEYLTDLRKFVSDNGLSEKISFYDFADNPTSMYAAADIVLMCSRFEAFGRVTVEAMLMGKAVIGAKAGATPEIIEDGYSGLLYRSGDYEDLGDKIHYLFENRHELDRLGANAQKSVAKKFSDKGYSGRIGTLLVDTFKDNSRKENSFGIFSRIAEMVERYKMEIDDKDGVIRSKNVEIESGNALLKIKDREAVALGRIIREKDQQLCVKSSELSEIHRSRGWRTVLFVRNILNKVFPRGSLRRKIAVSPFKAYDRLSVSYRASLLKRGTYFIKRNGLSAFIKKVYSKFTSSRHLKKHMAPDGGLYFLNDRRFFEEQQDYSGNIKHKSIKVLSYYLPQFHSIPENDKWHGKGFTEWHKVKAARRLFRGHYQPHVPHKDIGHYLLDSPDILKKQTEIMKKAGVFGQVFYHYWFTGKLILEKPAQMLLKNKDIDMPFCFCWANENWTRKWDGNEKEVLLRQDYSREDALGFITYLIPFFKDKRYITIGKRPVLFVYRPASFPDFFLYKRIWEDECGKNSLPAPYIVATLTRGATSPLDYGMDAGVERVMHDWTDGNVPEMKQTLMQHTTMDGSVLNYDDVARYYMNQNEEKPFRYFRSIVPIWDNTARYGDQAQLLHGSTPERFQEWFQHLIRYSESSLPKDEQMILVNAWNEWAEGAHLEPDAKFGYAYLNSVGRALSDVPFGDISVDSSGHKILGKKNAVKITFTAETLEVLKKNVRVRRKFVACLIHSTIFDLCEMSVSDDAVAGYMKAMDDSIRVGTNDDLAYDYEIMFSSINYFGNDVLERLLRMGIYNKASVICVNNPFCKRTIGAHFPVSLSDNDKELFPIRLRHRSAKQLDKYEVCRSAVCSMKAGGDLNVTEDIPIVTTILRFHRGANYGLLNNALLSLLSQADCIVQPLIATQDLSDEQVEHLKDVVYQYPWDKGFKPIISIYHSDAGNTDLRSRMLNESLFSVETKYAAFLDFDDVLYPSAYKYLIGRLVSTKKAVTFGNVFTTIFNREYMKVIKRNKVYEYGSDYQNFIFDNHAPLHSFMFDLEKLDLSGIRYFEDMKFMEDYYLTLQIFTPDNVDWESLKLKNYIGEYIHSVDSKHTLAIVDENDRQGIVQDKLYILCEKRIGDLRNQLRLKYDKDKAAS